MLHGYRQLYRLHNIQKKNIYVDIANDVETRFDTSNYESDRPLPNEKKNYRINGS